MHTIKTSIIRPITIKVNTGVKGTMTTRECLLDIIAIVSAPANTFAIVHTIIMASNITMASITTMDTVPKVHTMTVATKAIKTNTTMINTTIKVVKLPASTAMVMGMLAFSYRPHMDSNHLQVSSAPSRSFRRRLRNLQ